jgi:hypothetical protein
MKTVILGFAIVAATSTACNNDSNQPKETAKSNDTTSSNTPASNEEIKTASATEVVANYMQLKNALANDNAKDAATAGKAVSEAIQKVNTSSLTAEQKKVFNDVKTEISEHGEHIGSNGDKIAHQREHFDMLSNDMYDLVKAFGSEQTLYLDHCPMYNDNKGANWLSEVKDIKNPYLGKKMPTCGTVKEEIKK